MTLLHKPDWRLLVLCLLLPATPFASPIPISEATSPVDTAQLALRQCLSSSGTSMLDSQADPCAEAMASPDPVTAARARSIAALHLARRGDVSRARQYMDDALSGLASDPVVTANNGSLLLYEARYSESLTAFDAALQMPGAQTAFILRNRSLAQRALGNYAGAAQDYEDYLQILAGELTPASTAASGTGDYDG